MHSLLWVTVLLILAAVLAMMVATYIFLGKGGRKGSSSNSSSIVTNLYISDVSQCVTGSAAGTLTTVTATCPTGYVALGGGAMLSNVTGGTVQLMGAVPTGAAASAYIGTAQVLTGTADFCLDVRTSCVAIS